MSTEPAATGPPRRKLGLAQPPGTSGTDGVPRIKISGNPDAIRKLKAALGAGAIPGMYVTGGRPVRIERVSGTLTVDLDEDAPLPVTATPVTPPLLAQLLAAHTYTYRLRTTKDDAGQPVLTEEETTPPNGVMSAALAGAEWPGVPVLAGITGIPVLRRDWSLLQQPGYDPASGLYLSPTVPLPPVPERPTADDVDAARVFLLEELLADFEWEDSASRANYVALMVTPFLRRPLRALAPLGIISASAPASGKSLLSGLIGLLTGQQVIPWPSGDDAELEKRITSTFTVTSGAVIFDNLPEGEVIASPVLANLLTNPMWSSRLLGGSTMGAWPNDRLWMATGNNLRVGGDIASRSVAVRLRPAAPHPEARTGFKVPDLQGWIKNPANRAILLQQLLILIADWAAAGTPRDTTVAPLRQFTPWAHGTGGFLAHHGITGFLTNLNAIRRMDDDDTRWAVFLAAWLHHLGTKTVRVADVLASAERDSHPAGPWAGDFITDQHGRYPRTPQKLGQLLAGQADRYHGDPPLVLRAEADAHNSTRLYKVQQWQP